MYALAVLTVRSQSNNCLCFTLDISCYLCCSVPEVLPFMNTAFCISITFLEVKIQSHFKAQFKKSDFCKVSLSLSLSESDDERF